jgi:hypothetical protein
MLLESPHRNAFPIHPRAFLDLEHMTGNGMEAQGLSLHGNVEYIPLPLLH